jgi:hypothetical protein
MRGMSQNRAASVRERPWLFKPGTSGNPGGRPKAALDVQALARTHTTAAVRALAEALRDPKLKVAAATALLDRGWGKPAQHVTTDGETSLIVQHLLAVREVGAELPMLDAKPEPVTTKRLHLFDPPEE